MAFAFWAILALNGLAILRGYWIGRYLSWSISRGYIALGPTRGGGTPLRFLPPLYTIGLLAGFAAVYALVGIRRQFGVKGEWERMKAFAEGTGQ